MWVTRSAAESYPHIHSWGLMTGRVGQWIGDRILPPRVIWGWFMGRALVLKNTVDIFGIYYFSLVSLFVEDGIRQRFVLVKQSDIAAGVLANRHLGLAHGIA